MKKSVFGILYIIAISAFAAASNLPFINDDYANALASAKQRNLPIFVEVWAPW